MRPIFDDHDFIEWISRQNPDERYDYKSCANCLIARYFRFRGFGSVHVEASFVQLNGICKSLPDYWNLIAEDKEHTYGKALERARFYLR